MATVNIEQGTPPLRSQLEVVRMGSNARWGAVIAGVCVASSLWVVLHLLGTGVGMIAIDPEDASSARRAGIGVGVWSAIAPVIAMFVGGMVVSRMAPTPNRFNRMLQGGLMWSVTCLLGVLAIFLTGMAMSDGMDLPGAPMTRYERLEAIEASGALALGVGLSMICGLAAAMGGALATGHCDRRVVRFEGPRQRATTRPGI